MKIKNIFKKAEKIVVKVNIQKLEKEQLEKVVGGATEGSGITNSCTIRTTSSR